MKKFVLNLTENKKQSHECNSEVCKQKLNNYREKAKKLKNSLNEVKQQNSKLEETIAELQSSIVCLTEENIHLRAKMTKFRDVRELSNGIEQASELIQSHLKSSLDISTPIPKTRQHDDLVEEIEELKTKLKNKKREYSIDLFKSQPVTILQKPEELRPRTEKTPTSTKSKESIVSNKKTSSSVRRKQHRLSGKYIPSYLKFAQFKKSS